MPNKLQSKFIAAAAAPARDSNKYAAKQPTVLGGFDEYN